MFREMVDELETRGYPRTAAGALGAPVPDHLNFFKTDLYLDSVRSPLSPGSGPWFKTSNLMKVAGERSDLSGFPRPLGSPPPEGCNGPFGIRREPGKSDQELARDLLGFLAPYEERRKELIALCMQPGMSMPGNPRTRSSSSVESFLKDLDGYLSHHAMTSFHAGNLTVAEKDLIAAWRVSAMQSKSTQPLNSGAARIIGRYNGLWVLRESIEKGGWSDAQLERFEEALAQIRPSSVVTATYACLVSEMVEPEKPRHDQPVLASSRSMPSQGVVDRIKIWFSYGRQHWKADVDRWWSRVRPKGFSRMEDAAAIRGFAAEIDAIRQRSNGAVWFSDEKKFGTTRLGNPSVWRKRDPSSVLARASNHFLDLSLDVSIAAKEETWLVLARHAIALERHRRWHGAHPRSLEDLEASLKEPLPPDPAGGGMIHYRPDPSGGFTIWSSGKDGIDDGATGDDFVWQRRSGS